MSGPNIRFHYTPSHTAQVHHILSPMYVDTRPDSSPDQTFSMICMMEGQLNVDAFIAGTQCHVLVYINEVFVNIMGVVHNPKHKHILRWLIKVMLLCD